MNETTLFLKELFGEIDETLWFYSWIAPERKTYWFQSIEAAATQLEPFIVESAQRDCFVGVGLSSGNYGEHVRLKEEDGRHAAGIVGLWLDVDIKHAVHAKKNLPETLEEAKSLVMASGLEPSVVIHSGHGLQGWWLFKEPWIFESTAERQKAYRLSRSWSSLFKRKGAVKKWDVDSVFDLARIMRLPGTWNHKEPENPIPVKILEADWAKRYSPGDFEPFDTEEVQIERPKYVCGELVLSDDGNPPVEKLLTLLTNSPEFKKTWEHRRKDLPSNSEHDASLAWYAAQALWTDQEIANLLIAHRRQWGADKLSKVTERKDYIDKVISLARGNAERDKAVRLLAGAIPEPDEEPTVDTTQVNPPDPRQADLDRLSAVFGLKIRRMIQFGKEKPIYTLELINGHQIRIGRVKAITDGPKAFIDAVYAQNRVMMEPIPRKAWPGICEALGRICEVVDTSDITDVFSLQHTIGAYLKSKDFFKASQKDQACAEEAPFVKDGQLFIFAEALRKWSNLYGGDRWEKTELLNLMRAMGFAQQAINYTRNGKKTSKSYWHIAEAVFEDVLSVQAQEAG